MNCPGSSLPKVSIIIVTYNASNTLQRCLDSVFKQEYPNLELVIIDGESNDNTVEIIKANKEKIHFWTSEKDEGIYDAMNKGLEKITGEWVYFLGADDQLLDGFSSLSFELKLKDTIYYGSVLKEGFKYLDTGPITIASQEHRPAYGDDGNYFSKHNVETVVEKIYNMMTTCAPAKYPNCK